LRLVVGQLAGAVGASWIGRADYLVALEDVLSVCERDWRT
jgi:hypothetical protein